MNSTFNTKRYLFLILLFFSFLNFSKAVPVKESIKKPIEFQQQKEKLKKIKPYRKMRLCERLALYFINKKLAKTQKKEKTLANQAIWWSIAGFIPAWGVFPALVGLALGIASLFKTKNVKRKRKHKSLAVIAILLGLALVIGNLMLIAIINYFRRTR